VNRTPTARIVGIVTLSFSTICVCCNPDHMAISHYTKTAVLCAADPGDRLARHLTRHLVFKLYYRVAIKEWFADDMPVFGELVMCIDGIERRPTSWSDWAVTTRVDTSAYWRDVWQVMCCHRTQIPADRGLQQQTEEDHQSLWDSHAYYNAFSTGSPCFCCSGILFISKSAGEPTLTAILTA
jgi:hypothetical protein